MTNLQKALEKAGFKEKKVSEIPQKEIKSKIIKTKDKVTTESNKIWK